MAFAMKKFSAALKAGRARKRRPKVPSGVSRPEAPTRNFGLELTPPHFPGGDGTFKKGEMRVELQRQLRWSRKNDYKFSRAQIFDWTQIITFGLKVLGLLTGFACLRPPHVHFQETSHKHSCIKNMHKKIIVLFASSKNSSFTHANIIWVVKNEIKNKLFCERVEP